MLDRRINTIFKLFLIFDILHLPVLILFQTKKNYESSFKNNDVLARKKQNRLRKEKTTLLRTFQIQPQID